MKKIAKYFFRSISILLICLVVFCLSLRIILWDFFNYWNILDLQTVPGNAVTNFISDVKHFYWIYDEDWIIGKTANEIIERYGYFNESSALRDDNGKVLSNEDGLLLYGRGAYYLVERSPANDSDLLHIYFDENYRAYKIEVKTGVKGG